MRQLPAVLMVLVVILVANPVQAQFWDKLTNPQVTVTLKHPPGLGLTVKKIAFAPIPNASECADQFLDAIVTHFSGTDAEVVER